LNRFIQFFSQKLCICIALNDTFLGIVAHHWAYHLLWVLMDMRSAAMEDNVTTPAQAVFGTPFILPGQFLDSSELPSDEFLTQFSPTLNAAKPLSARHNTAAAWRLLLRIPVILARALMVFVWGDRHVTSPAPTLLCWQSLYHFTLQIGGKTDKVSSLRLKACSEQRPHGAASAALAKGPPNRQSLLGFSPAMRYCSGLQGTFCPTTHSGTAPGKLPPGPLPWGLHVPPLHCKKGKFFCTLAGYGHIYDG
jgi:hypothetical protein